jgi:hypothetical protein
MPKKGIDEKKGVPALTFVVFVSLLVATIAY